MVEPTPTVAMSDVAQWSQHVDVVVVGLGVAGACAALEAHRAGAEVLVVERASGGGGASAASEGIFYLGGGTTLQQDLGYDDSPENLYAFMRSCTTAPDDEALRLFCEGARDHFDWLEAQGLPFERKAFTKKAVAVRDAGLLMTGNEKVWPHRDHAAPVPRGHQTQGSAEAKGGAPAMQALLGTVAREGIATSFDTAVTAVVADADGAVRGVRVRAAGHDDRFVEARRGVVLATGSFNLNSDLTMAHFPVVAEHGRPLGIDSNDGAGLLIGQGAGVATSGMGGVIATASIYPPEQLVFGIFVNSDGERFVAEDSYHGRSAHAIGRQRGQRAFLLVDEAHFAYPDRGHPLVDVFDTIAELEAELEMPEGSVERTVAAYNADAAAGEDTRFGKHPDWLAPLEGPLAVFDLSYDKGLYSFISLGGLRADCDGRALDDAGHPIPGLYAVGAVAAHLPQDGDEYASGMSLGPGSFFGRRAGLHAAARSAVSHES